MKRSKGFTIVEGLLIAVAVLVTAGAVWYFIARQDKVDPGEARQAVLSYVESAQSAAPELLFDTTEDTVPCQGALGGNDGTRRYEARSTAELSQEELQNAYENIKQTWEKRFEVSAYGNDLYPVPTLFANNDISRGSMTYGKSDDDQAWNIFIGSSSKCF